MNQEEIGRLTSCFFPADNPLKADIAIAFGMSDPQRPVQAAIKLFQSGMVSRLLFTGGFNERLGRSEAHEMSRIACEGGVPRDAILIEDKARNTEENIAFSYRILKHELGSGGVGSVMLLTIQYHLQRAYIAARQQFPSEVMLSWTCYESLHYTSKNWFDVPQGRRDVMAELGKIERYYRLNLADLVGQRG